MQDILGNSPGSRWAAQVRHNDGELVTAQPRHGLAAFEQRGHAICEHLQHLIADRVSKHIIDVLEPIKVEAQYGELRPRRQCFVDLVIEPFAEGIPVGKAG